MEKVHTRLGDDMVVGIGVGIGIEWALRFDDAREQGFLIDTDTDPDNEHDNDFQSNKRVLAPRGNVNRRFGVRGWPATR